MSADSNVAPVIIKRKKIIKADGHHGGAWKVAYADFVTAMMAFFMLMWLLNATTEKQRKGIADYFSPTISVARVSGGGNGALGGNSVLAENVLPRMGTGATSRNAQAAQAARGAVTMGEAQDKAVEEEQFEALKDTLLGRSGESMADDDIMRHVVSRVTDEGLVVELFESEDGRLFTGDATPTPLLEALAEVITQASGIVTNAIAIEGHTAAFPIVLARDPAWDVSGLRATAFRELLTGAGIAPRRVQRVTSHADREPVRANRMDLRNNRLEIVFLSR